MHFSQRLNAEGSTNAEAGITSAKHPPPVVNMRLRTRYPPFEIQSPQALYARGNRKDNIMAKKERTVIASYEEIAGAITAANNDILNSTQKLLATQQAIIDGLLKDKTIEKGPRGNWCLAKEDFAEIIKTRSGRVLINAVTTGAAQFKAKFPNIPDPEHDGKVAKFSEKEIPVGIAALKQAREQGINSLNDNQKRFVIVGTDTIDKIGFIGLRGDKTERQGVIYDQETKQPIQVENPNKGKIIFDPSFARSMGWRFHNNLNILASKGGSPNRSATDILKENTLIEAGYALLHEGLVKKFELGKDKEDAAAPTMEMA
jgi:hypothetical protein